MKKLFHTFGGTVMNEEKDELRGYLLAECYRRMTIDGKKANAILIPVFCAIAGIIYLLRALGTANGSLGLLVMMEIALAFMIVICWLAIRFALDRDAMFYLNDEGISTVTRQKKYKKYFLWHELAEISEIDVMGERGSRYGGYGSPCPYIVFSKEPLRDLQLLIAADAEHAAEQYTYLYRHPELIAIPKTEEAVRYIARFHEINPLPEKYRI